MNHAYETLKREHKKLIRRLAKIDEKLTECPAVEFIELQQELGRKLEDESIDRLSSEFMNWVKKSAVKEKQLKRKMKTHAADQQKLFNERFVVERKLNDVSNQISRLSIRGLS